jgi:8-oxo-dGTP pyrophosphatase MutT (NUDIX family)
VTEVDRPGPGEEINDSGVETVPRQAATVIVLRGGSDALELLLVKRNPASRFMGGAWVFPGGAVDAHEGAGDEAHRVCAVRELAEEAGIEGVAPDSLVKYSRWITPAEVKIRFDTHFFLAPLPAGAQPAIDGEEVVDHGWFTPQGALDAHRTGEILLVFPTIKHLEQFSSFESSDALVAHAAASRSRGRSRRTRTSTTASCVSTSRPGSATPRRRATHSATRGSRCCSPTPPAAA